MDVQLKRGMLEICVLSSVAKAGETYGYQLVKDLTEENIPMSESTLYPILKRLEANELLVVIHLQHNGRVRKVYSITEKGRARMEAFLQDWKDVMTFYHFIEKSVSEHDEN